MPASAGAGKPAVFFTTSYQADTSIHVSICMAMQVYTESTDGSYLDVKESALVWHYKDADPDFGRWQAKVLHSDHTLSLHLSALLR